MLTGANKSHRPQRKPNGSDGRVSVRIVKHLMKAVTVQSISDLVRKDEPFAIRAALCYVVFYFKFSITVNRSLTDFNLDSGI